MQRFMTKKELLIIIMVILISVITLFAMKIWESKETVVAQVTYDGSVVEIISLTEDRIYHIDALLPVTLKVYEGKICFINSVCPNHDCEGFGLISLPHETAICLPARVSVQIIIYS